MRYRSYLTSDRETIAGSSNLDTVLTHPNAAGNGIGRKLVLQLVGVASVNGMSEVAATVHEQNAPSRKLVSACGFVSVCSVMMPYGPRLLYVRHV